MTSGIVRGRHLFGISWCSTWSSIHALASFLSHRARKRGGRSLRRRHRRRGRRILRVAAIKRINPAQVLPIARRQSARPIHLHEILVVVTALDHHPSPIPTEGKPTMLSLDPANIPYFKRRQGLRFGLQRCKVSSRLRHRSAHMGRTAFFLKKEERWFKGGASFSGRLKTISAGEMPSSGSGQFLNWSTARTKESVQSFPSCGTWS